MAWVRIPHPFGDCEFIQACFEQNLWFIFCTVAGASAGLLGLSLWCGRYIYVGVLGS